MQVTGILVFEDLEGGFWGIVGTDGTRFELDRAPGGDLAQPGIMVEAEIEPTEEVTIRQWGVPVRLLHLSRAET